MRANNTKTEKGGSFVLNVPDVVGLGEQIANEMKHAIASGEIKSGTHIKEAEIAGMLHISRSPVREAINLLISEQILEKRPHRGVYVYTPTEKDQKAIFDARILIESYAIEQLVKSSDSHIMDRLLALVKKIERAVKIEEYDWKDLMDVDLSFHEVLCKSTKNPFLISTWENLIIKQKIIFLMDNANAERFKISANEHMYIFEAIRAGEVEKAKSLLEHHIRSSIVSWNIDEI